MVAWASPLFVRSRRCVLGLSLHAPLEEMEVVRSHPHRERRVERVVFGGTLWSQNSLLLHNEQDLSIAIPYRTKQIHSTFSIAKPCRPKQVHSPFSIAKPCRPKQVHSTFRGASSVPSPWFFWVGHLFQPFFIIVWCMDCLFCRSPWSHPVLSSPAQEAILTRFTATGFLIHSVCPLGWIRGSSSSRSIGLGQSSIGLIVRSRVCFLGGQVLGDFPGLCKTLHETTPSW